MNQPDQILIEPETAANACVIILHGLGASGHDFEPVVPALKLPPQHGVRFVLPHAPALAVTVNNGMVMPAWYDILEMNIERKVDLPQLRASAQRIGQLIEAQIASGIDSQRIVVAGFSQGGAVAYETALNLDKPLAGLIAMSTYLPDLDSTQVHPANAQLPVQIHHGSHDPVVPESLGQKAAAQLKTLGLPVEYHRYPMDHSVSLEEIDRLSQWLRNRLSL